ANVPQQQQTKGILIYGASGTGKTLLCRKVLGHFASSEDAVAKKSLDVVCINGSESLEELNAAFKKIKNPQERAQQRLIFIDDLDSLCPSRESSESAEKAKYVSTLLALMDDGSVEFAGNCRLFFLCATNRVEGIDSALRRPGRLDEEIEL